MCHRTTTYNNPLPDPLTTCESGRIFHPPEWSAPTTASVRVVGPRLRKQKVVVGGQPSGRDQAAAETGCTAGLGRRGQIVSTSPTATQHLGTVPGPATDPIAELAVSQIENYRRQPAELVSHFNRENSALGGYRGRQLLELLQNADDAGVEQRPTVGFASTSREAAWWSRTTGSPFSPKGLTALARIKATQSEATGP